MKTEELYERALTKGIASVLNCSQVSARQNDVWYAKATRADRKLAAKIALMAGVIDEDWAKREIKNPWYNPYHHYKSKTHLIYVHSSIDHFIKIN